MVFLNVNFIFYSVKSQLFFLFCLHHLPIFSHLHRCLLELFPRRNPTFSLDTLAGSIFYFEKGVLLVLGLDGVNVHLCAGGRGGGGEEPSLICMIAVAVPVKLVKYYCLRRVLPDFVYKHWAGCLQGKEVTALSEP